MNDFDGVQRGNHFRGKPIRGTEVKANIGKLRNRKSADIQQMAI